MNTFERHRQYLLRRQRTRRLRRRALTAAAACLAVFAAWSIAARVGPPSVAPPAPAVVGKEAAREAVRAAAYAMNQVHADLHPGRRDAAKRAALRVAVRGEVASDTDCAFAEPAGPAGGALPVTPPSAEASGQPSRTVDILLIGVDSRLGRSRGRADALHLLTIDLTTPSVRITGIPRGTPSPLGYADESSDIISNVLAARGRAELRRRVARLCGRDSVPYFVQVGFSDAIGVLELLGYEHPDEALQALRQRKGYQYGDHDRCYNQGLFVREAMLRVLPMLEGATGELLLLAGLELLETNLTPELCRGIAYLLNDAGIGHEPDRVAVTLHSRFRDRIVGRPAPTVLAVAHGAGESVPDAGDGGRAERRIRSALAEAWRVRQQPERVRSLLSTMFAQHAWLQLGRDPDRTTLRDSLAACLLDACARLGDADGATRIRRTLRADDRLFPAGGVPASGESLSPARPPEVSPGISGR